MPMRDMRFEIGAPICEARVWNVLVTSAGLEES